MEQTVNNELWAWFSERVVLHRNQVVNYVEQKVRKLEDAEDIVHNALVYMLEQLPKGKLTPQHNPKAALMHIVKYAIGWHYAKMYGQKAVKTSIGRKMVSANREFVMYTEGIDEQLSCKRVNLAIPTNIRNSDQLRPGM